jgi:uncharacterized protein
MSTSPVAAPIRPAITPVNKPFWDACAEGVLAIQKCTACGHLRYPAGVACPKCLSSQSTWQPVSGLGSIFSFIVFHRAYHPSWEGKTPYNVSLIELAEGPVMLSNVVDVDNATLKVGLPVKVAFQRIDEALAIPVFRLA